MGSKYQWCNQLYKILKESYLLFAYKYIRFKRYLRRNRLTDFYISGHINHKAQERIKGSWESRYNVHRLFVVEKVAAFSPISSVLEIGCRCGPNLYLLSMKFPHAAIMGIDPLPSEIEFGNTMFEQEGISNVRLYVGRAEELGEFENDSFDVVFTDAVMLFISTNQIYEVVKGMVRIARKGIIFLEWHDFKHQLNDINSLGVFTDGWWVRDYAALMAQFVPKEHIHITKIGEDIWPGRGGWGKYGALVEVKLS